MVRRGARFRQSHLAHPDARIAEKQVSGGSRARPKHSAAGCVLPAQNGSALWRQIASRTVFVARSSAFVAPFRSREKYFSRWIDGRQAASFSPFRSAGAERASPFASLRNRPFLAPFSRELVSCTGRIASKLDCRRAVSIARTTLIAACGAQGSVPHESSVSLRSGSILPRSA